MPGCVHDTFGSFEGVDGSTWLRNFKKTTFVSYIGFVCCLSYFLLRLLVVVVVVVVVLVIYIKITSSITLHFSTAL
jgi:hypothetical protein